MLAPTTTGANVIVADVDPVKREAARAAGADHVIDNGAPDALAAVRELTGGGAQAAIDFFGGPASARFGFAALRRGGTLTIVGLHGESLAVSLALFPLKLVTVRGSYVGTLAEMHELMDLAKAGRVAPIPISVRPMAEATAALDDLKAGRIVGRAVLRN